MMVGSTPSLPNSWLAASCLCVVWMCGEEEKLNAETTTAFPAALQHTLTELLNTHKGHRGRQFTIHSTGVISSSTPSAIRSSDIV